MRRVSFVASVLCTTLGAVAAAEGSELAPWRVEAGLDWEFGSSSQPFSAYSVMNFGPGDVQLVLDGVAVATGNEGGSPRTELRAHESIVVSGKELSIQFGSGTGYAEGLVKVESSPQP